MRCASMSQHLIVQHIYKVVTRQYSPLQHCTCRSLLTLPAARDQPVEDLLQDIQDLVSGPVLLVPLVQVHSQIMLTNHALALHIASTYKTPDSQDSMCIKDSIVQIGPRQSVGLFHCINEGVSSAN